MTPRGNAPLFALLLAVTAALAGCTGGYCSPESVPTQVSIARVAEEVRTLPLLVSGATTIAGQEIPDAHGRLEFTLDVAHEGLTNASLAFDDVQIRSLRLTVEIAGESVPVEVLQVEGGSGGWAREARNSWHGAGVSGSKIVLWWTVDRDQTATPLDVVLPEGAAYTATVDFDWEHEDCVARAAGHVSQPFSDFVQASVNARTFAPLAPPTLELDGAEVGLRAAYRITSGLDVDVRSVAARAVFLGLSPASAAADATGSSSTRAADAGLDAGVAVGADVTVPVPAVGLALFPRMAWNVSGEARDVVTPADTLAVHSAAASSAAYARAGTMLGLPGGEGVWIVHVEIAHEPRDATTGLTTDRFAFAVEA